MTGPVDNANAPVRSQATLSYAGARAVLDAALTYAERIGVAVDVAVCDVGGNAVAFARMDGAPLLSMEIAHDKAYSVIGFGGLATSKWWSILEGDDALRAGIPHRGRLVIFGGGVAVRHDGAVVGAIGVSGGSAEQDEEIASAGAAALG